MALNTNTWLQNDKFESFKIIHNGSLDRRVTPSGYVKADTAYYFVTDHQGNVRQVVRGADGRVVQEAHYYPYGGLFGESSATALEAVNGIGENDRLFGGKERTALSDLQFLDFEARLYDPQLGMFWTCDPMMENYYPYSYRLYCLANPVNLVDPTGCIVVAKKEAAQNAIKNTLPKEAHAYLSFNDNGTLDAANLANYDNKDGSNNFNFLLFMAENENFTVSVNVSDSFLYKDFDDNINSQTLWVDYIPYDGHNPFLLRTGEQGHVGHTGLPGHYSGYDSTNGEIQVTINSQLSPEGQAQAFSHEGYGHSYLYMLSGGCYLISKHIIINSTDVNPLLRYVVNNAINETIKNMSK